MISCSELKKANPYLFNSWRAILYTEKGKRAGVIDDWRKFSTFFEDVHNSYKEGLRLSRKDKDKPFGPDNFEWVTNLELAQTTKDTVWLTYKGETKTLRGWSEEFGMSYNGLRQRYFRNKNYSIEEILFGKKRKIRGSSREYDLKTRASKYSLSFSKFALGDHNLIIAPKQNDLSYDIKVKVTGLKDGVKFKWGWIGTTGYIDITTDGIHMLNKPASQIRQLIVEFAEDFDPDHVVTIEQIPEYEGYLMTDGVDDKVQSSSFTMNEDWTIVGDWELLSNVQINCGIVKAQNVYLYNIANGLLISINNPRSLQSFGTKSLHAICSDGRLYDRNWVEYEYTADQNFAIVESSLNIGFNLNNYTQMAFKNLGIYNNQLLSKDDCIKAYNYLQTLKSK